jgi:sodium transport system permease protein
MNWYNVKLILFREVRDQLRDRRTLFMIAVLPILLYPLLGMSFFQIAQFVRDEPTKVLVIGAPQADGLPPLVEGTRFAQKIFHDTKLLIVDVADDKPAQGGPASADAARSAAARRAVQSGRYDAALWFPTNFVNRLDAFRATIRRRAASMGETARPERRSPAGSALPAVAPVPEVPSPELVYNTASDKSQIAYARLSEALRHWTDAVGRTNIEAGGLPPFTAEPFELATADVADSARGRGLAVWAKLLPVLLLIWALTGAFYPAIDLCAGEKERGTLETLLCSPAERSEIVVGKLLTIILFSMITAVMNLVSVAMTGGMLLGKLPGFGPPPLSAAIWLPLALLPVSALFGALSLALAAFARSTKEGQYYLMPLLLITMPLAVLSTTPGMELTLGNSLIPVTGVVLLLRCLLEGNYWPAVQYAAPVIAVTLGGCLLAIRWAVDQFNSESVLFRESERLDFGLWMRHLLRDRESTPTVAGAIFCAVVILLVRFFMGSVLPIPESFRGFALLTLVTQLVVVLTPALLMTIMLTNSPRQTLLWRMPPWKTVPAAVVLAVAVHPVANWLQGVVNHLYPIGDEVKLVLDKFFHESPSLWQLVLLVGIMPAICEELAFRGFILSGFRHVGHKWRAIVYSALFFGMTHTIFQQSLIASLLGVVLGLVAVQTGSLLPCIIFHMLHNSLAVVASRVVPQLTGYCPPLKGLVVIGSDGDYSYHWPVVLIGAVLTGLILWWFNRLPYPKSPEERLQDAIDRGRAA